MNIPDRHLKKKEPVDHTHAPPREGPWNTCFEYWTAKIYIIISETLCFEYWTAKIYHIPGDRMMNIGQQKYTNSDGNHLPRARGSPGFPGCVYPCYMSFRAAGPLCCPCSTWNAPVPAPGPAPRPRHVVSGYMLPRPPAPHSRDKCRTFTRKMNRGLRAPAPLWYNGPVVAGKHSGPQGPDPRRATKRWEAQPTWQQSTSRSRT